MTVEERQHASNSVANDGEADALEHLSAVTNFINYLS